MYCKTLKISQEIILKDPVFSKTTSPYVCNCTKRMSSLVFSSEYIYVNIFFHCFISHKHPFRYVLKNMSLKISQNSQDNTDLEFLFNKVAVIQAYNSVWKRLQGICFLVNFAKFLGTSFLPNNSEWVLLHGFTNTTVVEKVFF